MKIIINSDDFGFSQSINRGIIDAYKDGLISTTTIMINMPYAEDAISLWKKNKGLGLGLHINLTAGTPVTKNIKSITDADGRFNHIKDWTSYEFNESEVHEEVKAQVEKLISYDVPIDHLDCHHSLTKSKVFCNILLDIARSYNLPIRSEHEHLRNEARKLGVLTPDVWCNLFSRENAKAETISSFISENSNLSSIEIMCHLGYIDEYTKTVTSYITRESEINELKALKESGFYDKINLIKFKDL